MWQLTCVFQNVLAFHGCYSFSLSVTELAIWASSCRSEPKNVLQFSCRKRNRANWDSGSASTHWQKKKGRCWHIPLFPLLPGSTVSFKEGESLSQTKQNFLQEFTTGTAAASPGGNSCVKMADGPSSERDRGVGRGHPYHFWQPERSRVAERMLFALGSGCWGWWKWNRRETQEPFLPLQHSSNLNEARPVCIFYIRHCHLYLQLQYGDKSLCQTCVKTDV